MLQRRRFYMQDDCFTLLDLKGEEMDTQPSMLLDAMLALIIEEEIEIDWSLVCSKVEEMGCKL